MSYRLRLAILPLILAATTALGDDPKPGVRTLTGKDALGDWTTDAPGMRRKITVDDLATPYDTPSAMNFPRVAPRPEGAWPKAPEGFEVTEFATGLSEPRVIVRAPNGDLFLAESRANRVRVFRDADGDGKPEVNEVFATGPEPAVRDRLLPARARSRSTSTSATPTPWSASPTRTATRRHRASRRRSSRTSPAATSASAAAATGPATWSSRPTARPCTSRSDRGRTTTTTIARNDAPRSWRSTPTARTSASSPHGIRNPVGLATHPETEQLWASVNERDGLGDHLVPDYITHVEEGGFYGWPWYYIGPNQDPRYKGKHPELKDKAIVPDVLLQSHIGLDRPDVLRRRAVPEGVPPRRLRLRARLVEPRPPHRLQGHPRADEGRQGDRRVRGLPRRLRYPGGQRLGPAGGRGRGQGRVADGDRRRLGDGLAGGIHGEEVTWRRPNPDRRLVGWRRTNLP